MSIKEDHNRFRDIVKGKIRENYRDYITHGEMIGKQENEIVKIPVPHIDIPRFVYGPKQQGGIGQGPGKQGDSIDGSPQDGAGAAGNTAGEHLLEVDVTLDELAEILGEQLELPKIQPKGPRSVPSVRARYSQIAPVGPDGLRHFKTSFKQALKRQILTGSYIPDKPVIVPIRPDFRYRSVKKIQQPQTTAVVIYMMDVSGSMGDEQKQIVRQESFWINTWLRKHYKGLETRFIIHDAAAKEVDEKTFFSTSESGGTLISSAYKLCRSIIEEDYPPGEWNIYPFHFSDGDNWSGEDTRVCITLLREYFLKFVNMFGYGQVESKYGSGQFLKDLEREFPSSENLVISRIENRDKIIQSIKDFLGKGR